MLNVRIYSISSSLLEAFDTGDHKYSFLPLVSKIPDFTHFPSNNLALPFHSLNFPHFPKLLTFNDQGAVIYHLLLFTYLLFVYFSKFCISSVCWWLQNLYIQSCSLQNPRYIYLIVCSVFPWGYLKYILNLLYLTSSPLSSPLNFSLWSFSSSQWMCNLPFQILRSENLYSSFTLLFLLKITSANLLTFPLKYTQNPDASHLLTLWSSETVIPPFGYNLFP